MRPPFGVWSPAFSKSQALSRDGLPFPWNGAVSGLFSGPDQTGRPCRSVAGRGALHMKTEPKKVVEKLETWNLYEIMGLTSSNCLETLRLCMKQGI